MSYKVLSLKERLEWKKCLELLPLDQQDIYFTPEYYELYEKNGDGKAQCFVFENNGEIALYPFLINSTNQLGYKLDKEYFDIQGAYGYNGIVTSNSTKKFVSDFYSHFNKYCLDNNIIAEFTRFHPLLNNFNFTCKNMTIIEDRKTVFLDLKQSIDEIWKKCYSSVNRNMIRKAIKNGVKIKVDNSDLAYKKFYKIYSKTMKNVNAADYYFFDEKYFKNFRLSLGKKQVLLVAKYESKFICGMLLMLNNNYAHYHLSGRKQEYSPLASNNLILNYAIKYARQQGCKYFHFGGGNTTNENDHLLKFKSNFSKSYANFYFGKKVHNQKVYDEVLKQWEARAMNKNNNKLLKYRDI